jgi:hypothetical protein
LELEIGRSLDSCMITTDDENPAVFSRITLFVEEY